ncbi:casein kinase II subunit beta-2 isoform X2 [Brassica rapa]|uniref:Casein kinase II subunit beta n=1 Tax=Brassica campestris TaxID=3711 RepID=A0A3P6CWK5_BRACM|nr:casein kinase II subunit beta-2 isoform X2 [Brassica rapa]CAG7906721.1 unnamed protein product [Brassica rapa]VDD12782.1 unnamed protein product [Brassica rapa]
MYKESGLKSEVVDRLDNVAFHPMFQTVNGASYSLMQLHDHINRDSLSDGNYSFFPYLGFASGLFIFGIHFFLLVSLTSGYFWAFLLFLVLAVDESGISGSDVKDTSWISWFCNLRGNELFCQIDDYYIQDHFNLCGLIHQVPYYDYALDLILDVDCTHGERFTEKQYELVESAAEMLYGMIHARYILTSQGLASMLDKYKNYAFGRCPRVDCCRQPCLPIGQSDIPLASTIKIYCPKCEDVYYPRSKYQANIDGAYFGTTFPHLFLMTYEDLKPQKASQS